ncbi:MAG TPA: glycosyl hydrolase family 28-related protein [Kiritimatiellia bacterium]|nr:glycosyl hydrolase family 28-related protein [Candidatus Latescibacterota bacterium]HOR98325.1 glycosyl hydrolase family 28-related protein [Kiritimatiellia bacterium]HRU19746.1 glycosyl hydrolase family 28-related protein [Kiritimatiellia bacterium]
MKKRERLSKSMLFFVFFIVPLWLAPRSEAVEINDIGGRADGTGDISAVLQTAFAKGVRDVHFPKGEYCIGSMLLLPSGTKLLADKEARFVVKAGYAHEWVVSNADHENGNADITIEGGLWDGNCDERPGKTFSPDEKHAGLFFHFNNVRRLTLKNFHAYDSVTYHFSLGRVTDFEITNLRIGGERRPFCQDGIHMGGGCERGHVKGIVAHTGGMGDDLIALNADDVFFYAWNRDQVALPIRDITVENVTATNCFTVIRLLSVHQPIERCTFRNFTASYRMHGLNLDAARYCAHPIFKDGEHPNGVGNLKDITFENFEIWGATAGKREVVTYETNGDNVRFRNFRYRRDLDPNKERAVFLFRKMGPTEILREGEKKILANGETLKLSDTFYGDLRISQAN